MNNPNSNYNAPGLLRKAVQPLALAVSLALSACAGLPAADPAPNLSAPDNSEFVHAVPGQATGEWPGASWWRTFNDPQLAGLIEQAIRNSPSMAVAQARIAQSDAQAQMLTADTGASVAADASLTRQHYSANSIYPPPIGGSTLNSGNVGLNFSYDVDWWGRNRSLLSAALGRTAAARAEAAGAASTLSAAVATAYFQWQIVNSRIALQDRIEAQRNKLVALEVPRVKAGISAGDNVTPLHADAAAPRQARVQLETQRDQLYYQLKSLVGGGQFPEHLEAKPLPAVAAGLPANMPLDLIARRADVAASRERVKANLHEVDASRAAFYPDFNLTALVGFSSFSLSHLLSASSRNAGITPALHLPLFDAGRLRAGLNSSRADVTLAIAQYDQAVQNAVGEVNDAAIALQGSERERASLDTQMAARKRDLASAERRMHAGLTDGREAARDQLSVLGLNDQELLREQRALTANIALIKALGGGYQDPAADQVVGKN
jgi:multidrug efflux system outer membrane protein